MDEHNTDPAAAGLFGSLSVAEAFPSYQTQHQHTSAASAQASNDESSNTTTTAVAPTPALPPLIRHGRARSKYLFYDISPILFLPTSILLLPLRY